jgi:REP element-mobilizing transposase RayT
MTRGLERCYGGHDLHFITCSCYRRRPELGSGERRDLFLRVLEHARQKYRFVVIGYVVMPEHFHLLITEPEVGNPSVVMKVVKERFTKLLHRPTHPKTADEWGTRLLATLRDVSGWSRRRLIFYNSVVRAWPGSSFTGGKNGVYEPRTAAGYPRKRADLLSA